MAAAACGKPPEDTGDNGNTGSYLACMVTDTGGIDDRSFNAASWAGMEAAATANSDVKVEFTTSNALTDYDPNLNNQVSKGCKYVQAVGGLMADATKTVATANPTIQFSIVDADNLGLENVYPIQFETQQAAFLAGYLAAGYSTTGKVGTYGGIKIPPVTIFMDGFADGVKYYNEVKGTSVEVLGWNKDTQDGLFTGDFTRQDLGTQMSDQLKSQGADVILPVAGSTGLGSLSSAGSDFVVIWVDSDGCETTDHCSVLLSSVLKNATDGVKDALGGAATSAGTLLANDGFLGTLENGGVGLAPFHELDSKVDQALKDELKDLEQKIISGDIEVTSPAQPK